MDAGRRCFRLVGGVLVERTVGEVLPAVERNQAGLKDIVQRITEQREAKLKILADFQEKYKIRMKGAGDAPRGESSAAEAGKSSGVLA